MTAVLRTSSAGNDGRLEILVKIRKETALMLKCVEQGEWHRLDGLDDRRRLLVNECFPEAVPPRTFANAPEEIRELQAILAMNDRIVALSETERDRCRTELSNIQKGKVMSKAYRENP